MSRDLILSTFVPAMIAAACNGSAPVKPTQPVHVSSVDTLRVGQISHLRGSGLSHLRSLKLDGVDATGVIARSDSVAEFRVPVMRTCETDMRSVSVSADGSAPLRAIVRVPPSVSMRPAESRILTEDDLRCLRLPAADEDYVLSAANLAIPTTPIESPRALVSLRLLGTGDATGSTHAATHASASGRRPLAPPSASGPGMTVQPAMARLVPSRGNYSPAPVPFDQRYATATAGDTLRFVDWFSGAPEICQQPAESVPSFLAKVVVVSGRVAVVVDLRHPSAAAFLDPAKLEWLRDAAAITDRLLLPTMRSVFAADFVPPAGGGGRFYVLLGNLKMGTGFAYDGPLPTMNLASQASCPRSSEMVVSLISADQLALPAKQNARYAARVFLHEYAHSADVVTSGRGRIAGVLGEGLATLAEESAIRIGSGQSLRAVHSRVGSDAPDVYGSPGALGLWGTEPWRGPWQANGTYGANARMLLFLRELAGEASVDHGRRPTVFQRLIDAPIDWANRAAVIANITSVLGIEYAELTDRQTIASVTAGLIAPGVVHDLPRYSSWDHSERARVVGPLSADFAGRASRRANGERTLAAADGGHAALYLMGDGPRGISLELVSSAPTAGIVRLTRLR